MAHMSIAQLLRLAWSGRWRILLCTLACLVGSLAVSLRLPKSYEARARVLLEVVGADPVTGVVIGNKQVEAYVTTQQLLVGSGRVGEGAIDKLGWANNPTVIESWQAQTGGVGDIRSWAAEKLLGQISAQPLEGGGTLEIAYRAPEPDAAAAIVRAIRDSYISTSLALQTEAAARRAKRYETLVQQARNALGAAQASLTRIQRETATVVDPLGTDIESRSLGSLQNSATETAQAAARNADRLALNAGAADEASIRRKLVEVEQQVALAGATYGVDNPDYRALLDRRAQLSGQLSAAGAAGRALAAKGGSAARAMAAAAEADYQRERTRVLGRGDSVIKIDQAVRLVALRRGELNRLEANLANAQQGAERSESGLVVMGDVISDSKPVSPNIPLNLLLAALFGLGLGLASVFIDGLARREVLGQADLIAASGVPVLAVMPGDRKPSWWRRIFRLPRRRVSPSSSAPAAA